MIKNPYLLLGLGLITASLLFIGLPSDGAATFDREISPVGSSIEESDDYRFGSLNGETVYGPYLVDGRRYYYNGTALNSDLETVDRPEVEGLHGLYMKTYFEPIFYSPSDEFNMSGFKKYEEMKAISKACDLDYELIPQDFFDSMMKNEDATDDFLGEASMSNAEELIDANRDTVSEYSGYIGMFLDAVTQNISDNRCFSDDSDEVDMFQVTITKDEYTIQTEVLENYADMANQNAEALAREIDTRERELESGINTYSLETREIESENITYDYSDRDMYSPEDAKQEFNDRRADEITELQYRNNGTEAESESEEDFTFNYTMDDLREASDEPQLYEVESYCTSEDYHPVYGWDMEAYPNVISALKDTVGPEVQQGYIDDYFTVCRCPYVEITRLNWYVVDDLFERLDEKLPGLSFDGLGSEKVDRAEKNFIEFPGDRNAEKLSSTYLATVKNNLNEGEIHGEMSEMWRIGIQEKSRTHKMDDVYRDFYNDYHMDLWRAYFPFNNVDDDEDDFEPEQRSRYDYFLLTESEYALLFMTWSDTNWIIDEKPEKFSGTF